MYASSTVGEASYGHRFVANNASFNWAMAEALEPLFEAHQVGLALWGHVHNYERTCAVLNQTCRAAGGTVHVTAGTAGASVTLFPTHNKTSGAWSVRKCASNGSDAYAAAADAGVTPECRACADVTSCAAGHIPCQFQRCASPPAWSEARIEDHGYVRIVATPTEMAVEYLAVKGDTVGNAGVVVDRFVVKASSAAAVAMSHTSS